MPLIPKSSETNVKNFIEHILSKRVFHFLTPGPFKSITSACTRPYVMSGWWGGRLHLEVIKAMSPKRNSNNPVGATNKKTRLKPLVSWVSSQQSHKPQLSSWQWISVDCEVNVMSRGSGESRKNEKVFLTAFGYLRRDCWNVIIDSESFSAALQCS